MVTFYITKCKYHFNLHGLYSGLCRTSKEQCVVCFWRRKSTGTRQNAASLLGESEIVFNSPWSMHEVLTLVFLIALFNDTVNCWFYIMSVMNEWLWSADGMILTRRNWSTQTKTYPSATLSTTNPTRTEVLVKIQAIWDITSYRLENTRSSATIRVSHFLKM